VVEGVGRLSDFGREEAARVLVLRPRWALRFAGPGEVRQAEVTVTDLDENFVASTTSVQDLHRTPEQRMTARQLG
jgi:hypothetical protein